jgi:acetyltransferase-like isoleucine patch superfamily enzyme
MGLRYAKRRSRVNFILKKLQSLLKRLYYKSVGSTYSKIPEPARLDTRKDLKDYDIGAYTWGHLTVSNRSNHLKIGKFCSFAYGCHILLGGDHRTDWVTTYRFPAYAPFNKSLACTSLQNDSVTSRGDVVIGNDVWIGTDCLILSGVTIGDGAVIGAGSVVRRELPPYSIAYGNPARVIGKRFSDDIIEKLLEIKWWDWEIEKIIEALPLLLSENIEKFIECYGKIYKNAI